VTSVFRGAMIFLFLETPTAWAQSSPTAAPLVFEVASIKPSGRSNNGVRGGCHGIDSVYGPAGQADAPPLGRCVITNARLSHLVYTAWKMGTMTLIDNDGPNWSEPDERFNIEAKAENPAKATEQQLLTMLQALIVERFQMKYHREIRERPGFALTVAKNGPKLERSRNDDVGLSFADGNIKPRPDQPVSLRAHKYSIPMLVGFLSTFGGHGPGVDETGLAGVYDFTLTWDEENGPTIQTALREQLGLRMEMKKVAVSYFVIDSAQRPSPN
jgi:uncharacterized protein (TIGR03435 family)